MVGKESLRTHEVLNFSFEKLMMVDCGGNSGKGVNFKAGVITEWKDIPVELLMQILSLVDDQTVMIASEVCRGWREAICFGLTRLSLSWYIICFFTFPSNAFFHFWGYYACGGSEYWKGWFFFFLQVVIKKLWFLFSDFTNICNTKHYKRKKTCFHCLVYKHLNTWRFL